MVECCHSHPRGHDIRARMRPTPRSTEEGHVAAASDDAIPVSSPPTQLAGGGRPGARTAPWRYAIGMFGTSVPINMIKGSILLFYVDILGLDVRAYGIVMAIYAVIDAFDNPVLGYLSDRTRSRFGRRRPRSEERRVGKEHRSGWSLDH